MATAVAGEVLGPRPGRAICSFWQGNVEILLRGVSAVVGSLPAFIAACVALGTTANLNPGIVAYLELTGSDLERESYGSAGWVAAIAALAILIQGGIMVLRFCNIGLFNLKIKIFLAIDMILSIIFALGHLAGGVVCAIYASDWNDLIGLGASETERIRDSLAASAAFCFVSIFLYGLLAVWSLLFLVQGWNNKVVEYTLKDAVTS